VTHKSSVKSGPVESSDGPVGAGVFAELFTFLFALVAEPSGSAFLFALVAKPFSNCISEMTEYCY
ncbi:14146_t:CDS:1, partial [Rhizophagus irregularis]